MSMRTRALLSVHAGALLAGFVLPLNTVSEGRVWLHVGAILLYLMSLAAGAWTVGSIPIAARGGIALVGGAAVVLIVLEILTIYRMFFAS